MPSKSLTLRLPNALHAQLAALATQEVRSLNAQIVVLLQEALAARKRTSVE